MIETTKKPWKGKKTNREKADPRIDRLKAARATLDGAVRDYLLAVKVCSPFSPQWLVQPPLQRAAYSDRTAWVLAKMSELAYLPFEHNPAYLVRLKADLKSGGFQWLATFHDRPTDTQGFLAAYPGTKDQHGYRVLAFRGTEPTCHQDWMTDLRFFFQRWSDRAHVHGGFRTAWNAVRGSVLQAVAEHEPDLPLYVCGHSLGGAVAVLATYGLNDDDLAACYTYGCPRVGDVDFNAERKTPVYQVIHACDLVPRVPFSWQNFLHVGDIRFLDYEGRLLTDSSRFGRTRRWLFDSLRTWVLQRRSAWIGDHSLPRYIEKLEIYALKRNPYQFGHEPA